MSLENQDILDTIKCREIVSEIMSFGVNQGQIQKLIQLLSLELEDRQLMRKIISILEHVDIEEDEKPKIQI
tara:strand:- start:45 stop:257 length:213 start_codon:yes stop_codon:yes gene_type:complete